MEYIISFNNEDIVVSREIFKKFCMTKSKKKMSLERKRRLIEDYQISEMAEEQDND